MLDFRTEIDRDTFHNSEDDYFVHFGYGSNISWFKLYADLNRPDASLEPGIPGPLHCGVRARLRDYKFQLTNFGASTVVPSVGDSAYGAMYLLNKDQYARLCRCESGGQARDHSSAWMQDHEDTAPVEVHWRQDGEWSDDELDTIPARFYFWKKPGQVVMKYYLELIAESLLDRNLPATHIEYVASLMNSTPRRVCEQWQD